MESKAENGCAESPTTESMDSRSVVSGGLGLDRTLEPEELEGFLSRVIEQQNNESTLVGQGDYSTVKKIEFLHTTTATISFKDVAFKVKRY